MIEFIQCAPEPGNYDDIAQEIFVRTKARAVILMVAAGNKGTGFSVAVPPQDVKRIIPALREIADKMEAQAKAAGIPT